ncbi:MAG TPA: AraC family transcriptional regulator [Chitinophaga sp.]|uniref:helix-turn-helix transcriptional regulator n=1 Tax=Chitinophaga sp. TaxID=1869181 RepID=UPI002CA0FCD1|nr:AraC family transcriptional regulator [Chitinophaga sp.]HVI47715.1 AraC family transcriptional regulator [Chitinophaga sp.]
MDNGQQQDANHFPTFEEYCTFADRDEPLIYQVSFPEVTGNLRMMKMGSIAVSDGYLKISDKAAGHGKLKHFNELPLVEMNFVMEGRINQQLSYLKEPLVLTKGYHNVMYNRGEWESNRFIGSGAHNTFTINIDTERFIQLFAAYSTEMDHIVEKVAAGKPFLVQQPQALYTPYMQSVIQSIWDSPLKGSLRKLFLETKMMELMLLQWSLFTQPQNKESILKNRQDKERIHLAREILLKDIQQPPSLTQLAVLCGMNEFKLKKGFKEVFNDTVFGYFNKIRLEQARHLLLHTDKTITDIAYETGYAHPQHFNRAFKKQFGITPGNIRA